MLASVNMSYNSKYYVKSLKTNTVKSKNIAELFKKVGTKCSVEEDHDFQLSISGGEVEDSEKSLENEASVEV